MSALDETQDVFDLVDGKAIKRSVKDCSWHEAQGIEYLTSGKCEGPACEAYFLAHADDRVDEDGWA